MSGYRNVWGDNFAGIAEIFDNHMARPLTPTEERDQDGDEGLELEIDRILEEQAHQWFLSNDPIFVDWFGEHSEDFIPAMLAALKGDKESAGRHLVSLYEDFQSQIVDNIYRRNEVAEMLR
jgi:hypothetical protein